MMQKLSHNRTYAALMDFMLIPILMLKKYRLRSGILFVTLHQTDYVWCDKLQICNLWYYRFAPRTMSHSSHSRSSAMFCVTSLSYFICIIIIIIIIIYIYIYIYIYIFWCYQIKYKMDLDQVLFF